MFNLILTNGSKDISIPFTVRNTDIAKKWFQLNNKDAGMTERWLRTFTKPCIKCKTPIEKDEGCNHMRCQSCDTHFCWVCMQPWEIHGEKTGGFYECNLVEKEALLPNDIDIQYFGRIKKITKTVTSLRSKKSCFLLKIDELNLIDADIFLKSKVLNVYQTLIRYYDTLEWFEVGQFYHPLYEAQLQSLRTRLLSETLDLLNLDVPVILCEPNIIYKISCWAKNIDVALDSYNE